MQTHSIPHVFYYRVLLVPNGMVTGLKKLSVHIIELHQDRLHRVVVIHLVSGINAAALDTIARMLYSTSLSQQLEQLYILHKTVNRDKYALTELFTH